MTGDGPTGERRREIDVRAYLYLVLMVLIGSSTAPAAKFAVRDLPAGLLPVIRFGVAGLCLWPVVWWRGGSLAGMVGGDGRRLIVAAVLCVPVNQTFFLNGTKLAPTSHVALIYAACPLVVLLLAACLRQERLVPARLAGVLISILGVVVIGLDSLWRGGVSGHATLRGDLLIVGAVMSWGAYLTVSKPLVVRHGPLPALAGTFLVGALLHIPIALATCPTRSLLAHAPASAWWGLAYLVLVASVIGLAFQNLSMQRFDASQVATFNNAGPLLTVTWGIWLFGETMTPALILGGGLTLTGVLWTIRPTRSRLTVPDRPLDIPAVAAITNR